MCTHDIYIVGFVVEGKSDDDIEIIEVTSPALNKSVMGSSSKPHLLTKPVSISPVPPSVSGRHSNYSSVQQVRVCSLKLLVLWARALLSSRRELLARSKSFIVAC